MDSRTLEKVRSEALDLPDAETARDAEILRRLAEIDSDTANLIDWEKFRRRISTRKQ